MYTCIARPIYDYSSWFHETGAIRIANGYFKKSWFFKASAMKWENQWIFTELLPIVYLNNMRIKQKEKKDSRKSNGCSILPYIYYR